MRSEACHSTGVRPGAWQRDCQIMQNLSRSHESNRNWFYVGQQQQGAAMVRNTFAAKILLALVAFTLVVPESYAKRVGSGRSVGRQSQTARQPARPATPPPAPAQAPVQRSQPDVARQSVPPQAPPVRQASPLRGMLTGALVGLGLGSLISHAGDRDKNNVNNADGASGTDGTGAAASGENATQAQESSYGSYLLLGLLAFVVFFLVRRARRRRRGFLFK
ncbi:MAG: hypothetical protein V7606_202 [Burkholderiales bacterium]